MGRPCLTFVLPLAAALLSAGLAARAEAYVRYRHPVTAMPFFWPDSCVAITVYLHGYTDMTPNEIAKSVSAAAHTWSPSEVTCGTGSAATHPFLEIVPSLNVDLNAAPPPAAYDARNSVIFRTDRWSMSAKTDPSFSYNAFALAITSVFAKPDGHIVDADMELNTVYVDGILAGKRFANLDDPGAMPNYLEIYDLQNTLTHEFGHFIGLDHSCFTEDPSMPLRERPKDNFGNAVPDCFDAPDAVRNSVMFDSTQSREVSKRVLSPDEILAVCEIYPEADDPKQCSLDVPNDGIGCAVGQRPAQAPARRPIRAARGAAGRPVALAVATGALAAVGLLVASRRRR